MATMTWAFFFGVFRGDIRVKQDRKDFSFLLGHRGIVHCPSNDEGTERTWYGSWLGCALCKLAGLNGVVAAYMNFSDTNDAVWMIILFYQDVLLAAAS